MQILGMLNFTFGQTRLLTLKLPYLCGNGLPNQEYNSHLVCTSWIWGPWHCDWLRSIPIERYMSGILLKIWDISVNLHSALSPREKLSDQEKMQLI